MIDEPEGYVNTFDSLLICSVDRFNILMDSDIDILRTLWYLTNLHLNSVKLCSLRFDHTEDQRSHCLVSFRLPLPSLPLLKRHNIASASQEKAAKLPLS